MAIDPTRDPHARIVVKPLPSQVAAAKAKACAAGAGVVAGGAPRGVAGGIGAEGAADIAATAGAAPDPFLRAANEDDDGYDPYSDRPAPREPLFQEDPWA
ncbi:hypothetical protein VJ918_10080 [Adlercreutzia sp. R21]|uniref:hypothetical protein n=1 Tax=Adlercreutzia wanghongyangiae TaxID=3111451 RepID=UPI002DB7C75E|nr:hypothetical protein [Adlercreutzia sp. R21]MEC4185156.1 hypothetical protein [Adlercreutzia sp. R21]